jgi:hypothetical protein
LVSDAGYLRVSALRERRTSPVSASMTMEA